jgi:hypothetical protein
VPEDQGDRLEGAGRLHKRYMKTGGGGQGPAQDHHRRGARTAGLHLGHRDQGGSGSQQQDGGLTKCKNKSKAKAKTFQRMKKQKLTNEQQRPIRGQSQQQPEQARRRILVFSMRQAQPDSRL